MPLASRRHGPVSTSRPLWALRPHGLASQRGTFREEEHCLNNQPGYQLVHLYRQYSCGDSFLYCVECQTRLITMAAKSFGCSPVVFTGSPRYVFWHAVGHHNDVEHAQQLHLLYAISDRTGALPASRQ